MVYVPTASVHARLTVGSAFEEVTVVVLSLVFPSQPPCLWVYKQGGTARLSAIKTYSLEPVHSTQYNSLHTNPNTKPIRYASRKAH